MGDHRYGEQVGEPSTVTNASTVKQSSSSNIKERGIMSPRSVKNDTFDCSGSNRPENANPCDRDPSRLVEPPLMMEASRARPTFPVLPLSVNSNSKKGQEGAPQRRVIFPTYPRNQPQTYSWSWMRPGTPKGNTGTTNFSSLQLSSPTKYQSRDGRSSSSNNNVVGMPLVRRHSAPSRNGGSLRLDQPKLTTTPTDSQRSSEPPSLGSVRKAFLLDSVRLAEARLQPKSPKGKTTTTGSHQQQHAKSTSNNNNNDPLLVPQSTHSHSSREGGAAKKHITPPPDHSTVQAPVNKQPQHRSLPLPAKSILRVSPKYGPPNTTTTKPESPTSSLVKNSNNSNIKAEETSSLPSLVDIIKEDTNDDDVDDEDDSQSSTMSNCYEATTTSGTTATMPVVLNNNSSRSADQASSVAFDPRVWVREFHRAPEEASCTWYSDLDMDSFRRMALERIVRYQQTTTEILPTGTGRTIQRRRTTTISTRRPIYSHAALTLDGENDNDSFLKQKVMEKELQRVLVVDPHDICLKLFSKALQQALPAKAAATIVTATSTEEVLKHLEQGKRFDLIIVEERLRLFHRHHSSLSTTSSSSASSNSSTLSWLCSPKDTSNRKVPAMSMAVPPGAAGAILSSGAALIRNLSKSPLTSTSLFVGVSAHMKDDEAKLKQSGADFCWPKPPPALDEKLMEELVKALLIKRNHTLLASELFG